MLALASNFCFALGSQFFTHYSRKFSSVWMNNVKAIIACFLFAVGITVTSGWNTYSPNIIFFLSFSGFIGLGIGDIFLLKAFAEIGPARSMMLFAFQPVFIGFLSYLYLNQETSSTHYGVIICFLFCLFFISYEKFKESGHWNLIGVLFAIIGIVLDGIGLLITRYCFDQSVSMTSLESNFYRCLGAILLFIIYSRFKRVNLIRNLKKLDLSSINYVLIGCFLGTFLSLLFYLHAAKSANLATLTSFSITSTIFSAIFESIFLRRTPSKYFYASFLFFILGISLIISN